MASSNPHYAADPKACEDLGNGKLFYPRGLNIVWGKDSRYWNLPNENDKPAELLQVCWLEVTGSVGKINSQKDSEVIFKLSLTPDAFGWGGCPVYVMVKRGQKGKFVGKRYPLVGFEHSKEFTISCKLPKSDPKNSEETLYFGLYEVWSGKWKGGLRIHDVTVRTN